MKKITTILLFLFAICFIAQAQEVNQESNVSPRKSFHKTKRAERPFKLGINVGYGYLPSSFTVLKSGMGLNTSVKELESYFRKLKNGYNVSADFHGFITDKIALGIKYSFFNSFSSLTCTDDQYPYYFPLHSVVKNSYNLMLHNVEASVLFRQWLNKKRSFAINEAISFGETYMVERIKRDKYTYAYPNVILSGGCFSSSLNISFEYFPINWVSIFAGVGATYSNIKYLKCSYMDDDEVERAIYVYSEPDYSGFISIFNMSKLTVSFGANFYFCKTKKDK